MKKILFVSVLLAVSITSYCMEDSITLRVAQLETSVNSIKADMATVKNMVQQALPPKNQSVSQPNVADVNKEAKPNELSTWQKIYTVMPVLLFLLIFSVLIGWLRKDGFKLSDALQGDVPISVEVLNNTGSAIPLPIPPAVPAAVPQPAVPAQQPAVPSINWPPTVAVSQVNQQGQPVLPKSSSRFLALFSGMAAIIIALCLTSYYVYFAIRGSNAPDFSKMFEAIFGLGIGIVPYAVNKFTQSTNKP